MNIAVSFRIYFAVSEWVEITDPAEPFFGKRLRLESISRGTDEATHVVLRREDGIVLRVPKRRSIADTQIVVDT